MKISKTDGTLVRRIVEHCDGLYSTLFQPSRKMILERNAELRKNPGALNNMEMMGLELTMPEEDYWTLVRKYPDLKSSDPTVRTVAWRNFMGSREADPYRVRERKIELNTR